MTRLLRRLACPHTRYCHGQPMTWCPFRTAWVCGARGCTTRR